MATLIKVSLTHGTGGPRKLQVVAGSRIDVDIPTIAREFELDERTVSVKQVDSDGDEVVRTFWDEKTPSYVVKGTSIAATAASSSQVPLSNRLIQKVYTNLVQTMTEAEANQLVELLHQDVEVIVNKTRMTQNDLGKLRTKAENIIKSRTAQVLRTEHGLVMDGMLHYSGGEDVMFYKFINVESGAALVGKVYGSDDAQKAAELFDLSKELGCPHIVEYSGDAITKIQHETSKPQSVLLMPSFDYSLKELLDGLHDQVPPAHVIHDVVNALCSAGLAFERKGRVHGDIKPGNIMVKAGCPVCLIDYNGTMCGKDLKYVSMQYSLDSRYAPCSTAIDAVCAASTIAEMVRVWPISLTGYGTASELVRKLTEVREGQDEIPEGVKAAVDVALKLLKAESFTDISMGTTT